MRDRGGLYAFATQQPMAFQSGCYFVCSYEEPAVSEIVRVDLQIGKSVPVVAK